MSLCTRFPNVRTCTAQFKTHHPRVRPHSTAQLRQSCIALMRETAQSVSVVTAAARSTPEQPTYRGATLSSFTTVSMHPYPIVAFSLRKPSRMADLLLLTASEDKSRPHMVINLLSYSQATVALQFSRPHIYHDPFSAVPYYTSREGVPILRGCLGALSCALLATWPLDYSASSVARTNGEEVIPLEGEQGSELFLARVLRVEDDLGESEKSEKQENKRPLVYFRQQYVTVDIAHPVISLDSIDPSPYTKSKS